MLTSMTGFGKAESEFENNKITVEIKSLNSKQLDLGLRLPFAYREKEMPLRNELAKKLVRGKIEMMVLLESPEGEPVNRINTKVVTTYISQLSEIADNLHLDTAENLLQIAMRLPDSLETARPEPDEEEWNAIMKTICRAIEELASHQSAEGKIMESDIVSRIHSILDKLEKIEPFEKGRLEMIRERLTGSLRENQLEDGFDPNRFHQELIYYLDKMDITEEKVRLKNHCNYFLETVQLSEPAGKKLAFISQEIGREINTLGAKANNSDIQKLVIEMKDELEKIREQLLNVM